ncbi:rho-related GTP-binding protein RhoG-like [Histomonas meleagridis]|uniref:rho-related GTP-binding protein RhoG-like n=1 Tax=Histomonas meleagridis TaxID=135588 RepID=UPI00355A16F0|nr:rho-related GTP-binding protein RhoG-like [Histomonas meleagridis]KAH0798434.1 rho-related GTP-binding protein RhoG-like [Histomonas meleagridis]
MAENVSLDNNVVSIFIGEICGCDNCRKYAYHIYESKSNTVRFICFSVVDQTSFANVENIWFPELIEEDNNPIIILVGTKTDLRKDEHTLNELAGNGQKPITQEQGRALAEKIGAIDYMECTATNPDTIDSIFNKGYEILTNLMFNSTNVSDTKPQKEICVIQ